MYILLKEKYYYIKKGWIGDEALSKWKYTTLPVLKSKNQIIHVAPKKEILNTLYTRNHIALIYVKINIQNMVNK